MIHRLYHAIQALPREIKHEMLLFAFLALVIGGFVALVEWGL